MLGSPTWPGEIRQAAVPVKPQDPLIFGESAAAVAAQVIATMETDEANMRTIVVLP